MSQLNLVGILLMVVAVIYLYARFLYDTSRFGPKRGPQRWDMAITWGLYWAGVALQIAGLVVQ